MAELPPRVQEQDVESQRSGWPDPLLTKGSSTAAEVTAEPGWHVPSAVPLTGREPGCPQAPLRVSGISFLYILGSKPRDPGQVTQPLWPSVASRVEGNNNCEHMGFLEE